jgi:chromosome segregation ATPase
MMSMLLAEEERQASHLKAVLGSTGDRLEQEMRRTERAEQRADHAEVRAKELALRISAAESAQHSAELHSIRLKEDMHRFQVQVDTMQRELIRAQEDIDNLERKKAAAEDKASKARDVARKFQTALDDFQAAEEERDEARRVEIQRWYDIGRQEGWDAGHKEGFEEGNEEGFLDGKMAGVEEGRRAGRDRGWEKGREQGRKEERQVALRAFDKYLKTEMLARHYHDVGLPGLVFIIYTGLTNKKMQDRTDSMRWTQSEYFDDRSEDGSSYFTRTSR